MIRKEWFISAGAIVPAFLASQHHNLMLLLMATGLSGVEASSMTAVPLARRAMLLLSLAMLIVLGYQIRDSERPRSVRIMGAFSIAVTVAMAGWSVMRFGL